MQENRERIRTSGGNNARNKAAKTAKNDEKNHQKLKLIVDNSNHCGIMVTVVIKLIAR